MISRFNSCRRLAAFVELTLLAICGTLLCAQNYATPYYFTTLAGSGSPGLADGAGTAARFDFPLDLTVDAARNVLVGTKVVSHFPVQRRRRSHSMPFS
jgi:hypothetical protein